MNRIAVCFGWALLAGLVACGGSRQRSHTVVGAQRMAAFGGETQNGGYGLRVPGSGIVSLDLFERGAHLSPYLSDDASNLLTREEKDILHERLGSVAEPGVIRILERKISDIRARLSETKYALQTRFMIRNLESYSFIRLDEMSCLDVGDDHSPYPGKVQLAYREGRWVRFCREYASLDEPNRAALILHEIVYAALSNKSVLTEFVGYVFHSDFARFGSGDRAEFFHVVSELRKASKDPRFFVATDLVAWSALARAKLPEALRERACAAWGVVEAQPLFGLWIRGVNEPACAAGETTSARLLIVRGDELLFRQLRNNVPLSYAGGYLNEFGELDICSGAYDRVCRIQVDGDEFLTLSNWHGSETSYPLNDVRTLISAASSLSVERTRAVIAAGAPVNGEIDGRSVLEHVFSLLGHGVRRSGGARGPQAARRSGCRCES